MKRIGDVLRSPHARLLTLAVALTAAGAAGAGAVVLVERSARVVEHVAGRVVAEPLENAAADSELAASASPNVALRRISPRSVPPSAAPVPVATDPSLPSADEAVRTAPETGEGPPITF